MKKVLSLLLVFTIIISVFLGGCNNSVDTDHEDNDIIESSSSKESSTKGGATKPKESTAPEESIDIGPPIDTPSEHVDDDDNGLCDYCGISVIIVLDIFAVNDLHGKLCDSDTQIGVDEMTTYLKYAYENEDNVLILSSGDMWQGSSESNLTRGLIVTEWMNELGFVSMTLGNHEYDWGEEFIKENAELAEFPLLAINVYDVDTDERVDYCSPSVLVERGGATIGVIGAIGDCHSSISGEFSGDVYFKVGNELTDLVKEEATRLREAGADFIIYSIHDGHDKSSSGTGSITNSQLSGYYDSVLSDGYVDIVFEGHTHRSYVLKDIKGVYHMQNGGDNSGISHAEAVINFANGNSSVRSADYIKSSVYENLADDPIVNDLMYKYEEQVSAATRILGMNDFERNSNELRQIMSELYLKAGLEAFGDDYDIVLGGGFMSVRSPGYLAQGEITFAEVQGIFPFENTLVLCSIKGQDLLNKFINTTNSNYFVSYSDYGESVKDSIDPNGVYYVITDTYSSTYTSNRLTEIKRYTEGVYAQHLLADYIEAGGLTSSGEATYLSISDVLEMGASLAPNEQTDVGYYVKGTVSSIENTTWGNLYIEDENGNQLYVYGLYDSTGKIRYDAMSNPPKAGDHIALYGPILNYVNQSGGSKIEIKNARLVDNE